jgi:opine dehydrogenase
MNITIVGGGNIGTQFAVHAASKGHQVTIFTSKPEKWSRRINIVNHAGEELLHGEIKKATNNTDEAFLEADLIFVTVPAFCMADEAGRIEKYAHPGLLIGLIPGTGGGEVAFRGCIEKGAAAFGLQRVPSVARLVEYGKSVCATGYRDKLFAVAMPHADTENCCNIVSAIFDMPCDPLPAYLNLMLTPSNPILHTTRLYKLFEGYKEGVFYPRIPLFYEEWNDETSRLLFACDDEVQDVCRKLTQFDLSYVKSLKIHYESDTPEKLTRKIASIEGFKGIKTPMVETSEGFLPDFNSRYFKADFPYGLAILIQIAELSGVKTPNMRMAWNWYLKVTGEEKHFSYSEYGINSLEDFILFYSK